MKKIFISFLTILLSISWYINLNNDSDIIEKSKKYMDIAENYYNKGLYIDALNYYRLSNELVDNNEIKNKMVESYLKIEDYNNAFKYLSLLNKDKEIKTEECLDFLLEKEEYSKYNYFLNLVDENTRDKYYRKNFLVYKDLDINFEEIIHDPSENLILGKNNNQWQVINNRGKSVSQKYEEILNKNEEFLTVKEKGAYKVIDQLKNIRSSLEEGIISGFKEDFLVQEKNNKQVYIDRTSKEIGNTYNKCSNFANNLAVVFDDRNYIIDKNFKRVKVLDGNGFKVDQLNNAIIDNKIIVSIGEKFKIYDLINEKYSELYDDIDFSYGEYIAIKSKENWGYINQSFEEIIAPKYSLAKSFNQGIGVVNNNNQTLLIDKYKNKKAVIGDEIKTFNKEGISFIKKDDKWSMVKLVRFINDWERLWCK